RRVRNVSLDRRRNEAALESLEGRAPWMTSDHGEDCCAGLEQGDDVVDEMDESVDVRAVVETPHEEDPSRRRQGFPGEQRTRVHAVRNEIDAPGREELEVIALFAGDGGHPGDALDDATLETGDGFLLDVRNEPPGRAAERRGDRRYPPGLGVVGVEH